MIKTVIKIQNILISDPNFNIFYNSNSNKAKNSYFVSELLNSIHEFGKEAFENNLNRIVLSDTLIDLIWHKDYIFFICAKYNQTDELYLIYHNKFVEEIVDNLKLFTRISEAIQYFKIEINMYSEGYYNDLRIPDENIKDLNITMSFVCEASAVPISYLSIDRIGGPMLIGPTLTAISGFSNSLLKKSIEQIDIGKNKIFFKWNRDNLFIIVTKNKSKFEYYNEKKRDRIEHLLSVMNEAINLLINSGELVDEDLNAIMYTFINDELQNFRGNLSRELNQKDLQVMLYYGIERNIHNIELKNLLKTNILIPNDVKPFNSSNINVLNPQFSFDDK